jgi:hypothetical protein
VVVTAPGFLAGGMAPSRRARDLAGVNRRRPVGEDQHSDAAGRYEEACKGCCERGARKHTLGSSELAIHHLRNWPCLHACRTGGNLLKADTSGG